MLRLPLRYFQTNVLLNQFNKSCKLQKYQYSIQKNIRFSFNIVMPLQHKTLFKEETQSQKTSLFRWFCSKNRNEKPLSLSTEGEYDQIAEETLQNVYECFENVLEESNLSDWDVNYSNGVLSISLNKHGVYVLNKQAPNKQIWLSSPISGPKRYDFIDGKWIYKHDGVSLNELLTQEITNILEKNVSFMHL